jgi:hypothetical protein
MSATLQVAPTMLTDPIKKFIKLTWLRTPATTATVVLALFAGSSQAVPSYARQTGSDCAACHVGAFGPQLTPYGVQFKIGGYTDTDGKSGKLPLSAMLVANFTRTAAPTTEPIEHYKGNNNSAVQEVSVFLAGRLMDNVGAFVQSTYSGVDRKYAFDQLDLRYARSFSLGGKETVAGLSLNNNPTLSDPFNTLGQWRFPYTASDFGFGQGPTPLLENLGNSVLGLNGYALFDKHFYAELGLYNTLSQHGLRVFNAADAGKFKGLGTYWRLAYVRDRKRDNFSVGLVGFNAGVQPDRTQLGVADRYNDVGIDAAYQYLGNREHVFTVNASYIHERQTLNYTQAGEGAQNLRNSLDNLRLAASYHYAQAWGLTASLFNSSGSADPVLYGASYGGKPDTAGYVLQADWTPWGKETSWLAPSANLRLGVQFTGYSRFNGASHYIDAGTGEDRKASDNNTTLLFGWLAF